MASTDLYFVRHGEAAGADSIDPGLSHLGRSQSGLTPVWRWMGLAPATTSLTVIRCGPGAPNLLAFNDTGHLDH